jgi:hypothetical protein
MRLSSYCQCFTKRDMDLRINFEITFTNDQDFNKLSLEFWGTVQSRLNCESSISNFTSPGHFLRTCVIFSFHFPKPRRKHANSKFPRQCELWQVTEKSESCNRSVRPRIRVKRALACRSKRPKVFENAMGCPQIWIGLAHPNCRLVRSLEDGDETDQEFVYQQLTTWSDYFTG